MLAAQLPLVTALPFVALLVAIAVMPLLAPAWWHSNRNKAVIVTLISLPILAYFLLDLGEPGRELLHEKFHEYLSFIVVIAALFVVAGGIQDRKSTRLNSSHGYISYAVFCFKKK